MYVVGGRGHWHHHQRHLELCMNKYIVIPMNNTFCGPQVSNTGCPSIVLLLVAVASRES